MHGRCSRVYKVYGVMEGEVFFINKTSLLQDSVEYVL